VHARAEPRERNSCIRYPLPFSALPAPGSPLPYPLPYLFHRSCCRTGKFEMREATRSVDFGFRRISPNACIFVRLAQLAALIARLAIAPRESQRVRAGERTPSLRSVSIFVNIDADRSRNRSRASRIFGYSKCRTSKNNRDIRGTESRSKSRDERRKIPEENERALRESAGSTLGTTKYFRAPKLRGMPRILKYRVRSARRVGAGSVRITRGMLRACFQQRDY
jgi:hypothetical protein